MPLLGMSVSGASSTGFVRSKELGRVTPGGVMPRHAEFRVQSCCGAARIARSSLPLPGSSWALPATRPYPPLGIGDAAATLSEVTKSNEEVSLTAWRKDMTENLGAQ